jgi:hypothetical protein
LGARVDFTKNGFPVPEDSFEGQLPDDLKRVADLLRDGRPVADGPLLERALRRASAGPPPRRSWRLLTPRTAMTVTLALACVLGVKLAHLNVAHAVATLAGNTSSLTSGPSSSAAGAVYCGEGSGSGSSGWAPTFRWHYGGIAGADDGWSASVQPTCPNGALTIRWSDDSLSLSPGTTLYAGYDFHTSNQPTYTMTAYSPTVVFSPITCADKSTPTQSTITLSMLTHSYTSVANTWIPTGDKTSSLGFQGTLTVPNVCHGAKVIFNGGTFSAVIKVS